MIGFVFGVSFGEELGGCCLFVCEVVCVVFFYVWG